jgi:Ca2+-binding EF-hand superfamily protein
MHRQVFDKDGNGSVSLAEFKQGLGLDFGENGEQMTEWIFR